MPKSNRSSIHVDLFGVNTECLHTIYTLRRERLVDLPRCEISHSCVESKQTSNKSTSSCVMPAFLSTMGIAYRGAIPITRGATPDRAIRSGSKAQDRCCTGHRSANEFGQNGQSKFLRFAP